MIVNGRLVLRLLRDSEAGKTRWQSTRNPGIFSMSNKAGSVRVYKKMRENEEEKEIFDIIFEVFNDKGRLVDEFSDKDLSRALPPPNNEDSWFMICKRLAESARRIAMNAEEVMENIIKEMDIEDEIPF